MVCCGDDVVVFNFMRYMKSRTFLFLFCSIFGSFFHENLWCRQFFSVIFSHQLDFHIYYENEPSLKISYRYFIQWKSLNHFWISSLKEYPAFKLANIYFPLYLPDAPHCLGPHDATPQSSHFPISELRQFKGLPAKPCNQNFDQR